MFKKYLPPSDSHQDVDAKAPRIKSFVVRTTIMVGPSYWMDLENSTKSLSEVLVEYKNLQVLRRSRLILLLRNRMEALSRIEQSC